MIMYKTGWDKFPKAEIESVVIDRANEKTVWLTSGRRENRSSEGSKYHDTWQQAHEYLITTTSQQIDDMRSDLVAKMKILERITEMEQKL